MSGSPPHAAAASHQRRLPADKEKELAAARRQEWATWGLRLTVIAALYGVVGNSQALSAIWLNSLWALWPPLAFLAASALERRPPSRRFPFGFYRAVSIGFLTSALSLVAMGAYLIVSGLQSHVLDDPDKLATISAMPAWWQWPGWWVVAALAYSMAVPLVIGRRRKTHAINLHDKGLYADASMGQVNWMAAATAICGVLGIGLGVAWLDIAATLLIGVAVFGQGLRHLYTAICDLMDEVPRELGSHRITPLVARIHRQIQAEPWVETVRVRLREEGRMLTGIALICPDESRARLVDMEALRDTITDLDWRLLDFQLVPVSRADFERECSAR